MTASREDRAETAEQHLPTADSPTTALAARSSGLCLSTSPNPTRSPSPTRRTVVTAVGAVGLVTALVACGSEDDKGSSEPAGEAGDASENEEDGGAGGAVLAKTADIPVGGGKIFKDEEVVVTQPKKGEFKAFSNRCTHKGCAVTSVEGGTINCPCHGSKFDITDGSVQQDPAPKPLPAAKITVEGDSIKLA
ncbi:Rieske (2Fe-2S) protein [Streptomyces flavofungini]|uniref:Cytochrome bc1 complex Rieske iron-sulfur subunit n=1 Tax=Streptomyces flavofungini TaxID=68200 RepID=A0ABS0XFB0_9ACTN|nr:Rieske (2Fe-2S) protein [Streptomyces flavofungini]MBJ3811666.1 Rieske (2Fe-2S) protein [Streptomyces flavofungini]GHC86597.1 iron-sulfur protein [Streptomyces flavofungini]